MTSWSLCKYQCEGLYVRLLAGVTIVMGLYYTQGVLFSNNQGSHLEVSTSQVFLPETFSWVEPAIFFSHALPLMTLN